MSQGGNTAIIIKVLEKRKKKRDSFAWKKIMINSK